jgi:hypothetical protein
VCVVHAAVASDYALWDNDITTEELTPAELERYAVAQHGCMHSCFDCSVASMEQQMTALLPRAQLEQRLICSTAVAAPLEWLRTNSTGIQKYIT